MLWRRPRRPGGRNNLARLSTHAAFGLRPGRLIAGVFSPRGRRPVACVCNRSSPRFERVGGVGWLCPLLRASRFADFERGLQRPQALHVEAPVTAACGARTASPIVPPQRSPTLRDRHERARRCAFTSSSPDILRRRTRSPRYSPASRSLSPPSDSVHGVRPNRTPASPWRGGVFAAVWAVQRGYWGARTSLTSSIPRSTLLRLVYVSREVHLVFSSLPRRVRPTPFFARGGRISVETARLAASWRLLREGLYRHFDISRASAPDPHPLAPFASPSYTRQQACRLL